MLKYSPINIKTWSIMGANGVIGTAVMDLPELNDKVIVMTADQCLNSGLTRFKNTWPDRFINAGISEQNMITMAGGMFKEGLMPYVTAQAPFMSMRSTDQVRVTLGYMKLGVKILGLSAGFSQGEYGATHHCINDIAIMRSIPNLTVLSPADCTATVKMILSVANSDLPVYIRLTGVTHNPIVYNEEPPFEIGKANLLKDGKDVTVFATGTMVYHSLKAADLLAEKGIDAKVYDMHTIKPLDVEAIKQACDSKMIVTVEEGSVIGGLGGAVAEVLATRGNSPRLCLIGAQDTYIHADEYARLLEKSGLTAPQIAEKIMNTFKEL
ncbi:MAG: transketolase [Alphaproteobacteria bacterium]|nr:transketolase [Alphaproteobacteria bacterium]